MSLQETAAGAQPSSNSGFLARYMHGVDFNYDDLSEWHKLPGSKSGGKRQSPINILTSATKSNSKLLPLQLSGYDDPQGISVSNKGTNIKFHPLQFNTSLKNHLGVYNFREFHFHWGCADNEGSEHTIDGQQFAAEIHFVHLKEGASPTNVAGDTLSVIGVLCKAADIPVSGVWSKLGDVPIENEAKTDVKDIVFSNFLPKNLDYYHYEGSLTTPLCNEIIQWFVLKETIDIPKSFLASFRKVQMNKSGKLLTHNFRDLQPLNDRVVYRFSS